MQAHLLGVKLSFRQFNLLYAGGGDASENLCRQADWTILCGEAKQVSPHDTKSSTIRLDSDLGLHFCPRLSWTARALKPFGASQSSFLRRLWLWISVGPAGWAARCSSVQGCSAACTDLCCSCLCIVVAYHIFAM